jgi:C1A family cysteine protease
MYLGHLRHEGRTGKAIKSLVAISVLALFGCGRGDGSNPASAGNTYYGATLPSKQSVNARPQGITAIGAGQGAQLAAAVDLTADAAMPVPGDQRSLNACVAWAIGYDMTSFLFAKTNGWNVGTADHQGSPADLYNKTLQALNLTCNTGTDPEQAMQVMVQSGIASMAQVPYVSGACGAPSTAGTFGIQGYHVLRTDDPVTLKRQLAGGNVLPFGAYVYSDLSIWGSGPNRRGIYTGNGVILPNEGHVMALVGYDDSRHAWRVMNSWGTNWGDNGFFWMDYNTFTNTAVEAFVVDGGVVSNVSQSSPATPPSIQSLEADQYFDYTYGVAYLVLTYQLSEPIYVTQGSIAYEDGSVVASGAINQWVESSYLWWSLPAPSSFPDGTYTVTLVGTTRKGQAVTLTQSAVLSDRGVGARSLPGLKRGASRARLTMPSSVRPASLRPGTRVNMNGQTVTLRSR